LARKTSRVSVFVLVCAHLLLVSCGNWGQGAKTRKPPQPPATVKAEMVDQGLQISWKAVPGATKYTVFWGFAPGEYRGMLNTPDHAVILAGLGKGEIFYLAVTSWNARGESKYAEEQAVVNDDDPRHASLYVTKGQDALQRGAYVEANAYLCAAIRLDPQNAEAYRHRGMLYERLSKSDLAHDDYQRAELLFKKKLLSKKRASS
jgi:tetratricopeptide (TPR) repeat protein